jgi:hypothetical protein
MLFGVLLAGQVGEKNQPAVALPLSDVEIRPAFFAGTGDMS